MCLSIEVAVWVVYYLFGFNGKIHADFRFPFSFLGIFAHLSSGFFWSPASGKGCLDVAYKRPLPPSPFLRLRRCPGTARSAAFCLLYTITDFPLWAKALLRKEKLLPFLLCAASPPSGEVSRSGRRLGRLLQGRTINGSSLHVPPASSTAVPSACCKKYVGKSCSFASLGLFSTRWCHFFLSLSLSLSLFFPSHFLLAKSHRPAHGIAQICFCAVGGEENQECQRALGNRRSSSALLAQAACPVSQQCCVPALGFCCHHC